MNFYNGRIKGDIAAYNGAFTNMYDASNRNGKITLPFDLSEN